ncbi:hypothetical protein LRH25_30690 [Ideonella azotifigens]|uniref:Helix-turn-helix domain-containing protein n=1 Tax=Ideonella azotifigens TaxID=513160 RepID=A0ABN1JH35_9BURK|nr:helix-turn-helix domain-containing protein [Ideonella azotifigens]MCD2344692.1 hypothetical protein [Ideonella azotifigens]
MNDPDPNHHDGTQLAPRRPPGRGSRKARAYAAEMARLQALDYTLDAICEALADIGVTVSRSTVHRELARRKAMATSTHAIPACADADTSPRQPASGDGLSRRPAPSPPAASAPPNRTVDQRGKDIAETFMRGHITNPLIRARQRNEEQS